MAMCGASMHAMSVMSVMSVSVSVMSNIDFEVSQIISNFALLIPESIKMTPESIHTKVVPALQAVLWTIALFIGTVSFQSIGDPVLVKLISVFIIFLVFIWESAIMFLDIKNANPGKNFDGGILSINTRLFFIIPIPFIVGTFYYAYPAFNSLFYLLIPIMGWLKWECSSFANNIQTHFVDIKPTFIPNKINE